VGAYASMLTIKSAAKIIATVSFVARRDTLQYTIAPQAIDLGSVGIGRTTRDSAKLTNQNPISVRVSKAQLDSTFQGRIITQFPKILSPNGTLEVIVEGAPKDTGM